MQAHYEASEGAGGGHRAPAGPPDVGLYFLGPLHELVAIGLHRPALEALCAGQRDIADPPIDRDYLLKILDEEVTRQFGHPLRPIVELILNAVDASVAAAPTVEVAVGAGHVEVRDAGAGMGLRAILSRLLIPFATDKQPGIHLGRFGVGFFSVLGIGLWHPDSFALSLTTGDGTEGWAIRVVALPMHEAPPDAPVDGAEGTCAGAAEGPANAGSRPTAERRAKAAGPAELMCSVRRVAPFAGTRVRVASALLDASAVRSYVRDALHFFPPAKALVLLDGAAVNDGAVVVGGELLEEAVMPRTSRHPAPLSARFHLGGRPLLPSISAATFHAGVKVEACLAIPELAFVDFPGEVELTEGRDALKSGPEFIAVAAAFHRRLVRLAVERDASRSARDRLAEIAAQISALMLQSAGWDEVARELARALLGPGRCMVGPERREALLGFLGPSVAERLFVPDSFWAEREWQPYLPGERELLEDELDIDPPETLASLARRRGDLAGLGVLLSRAANPHTTMVALCRSKPISGPDAAARAVRRPGAPGRRAAGPLPCLGTRRLMLVRDDSAAVRRPAGWHDGYALRAAFDRASGVRESDFERDLIVGEPLDAAGADSRSKPSGGER